MYYKKILSAVALKIQALDEFSKNMLEGTKIYLHAITPSEKYRLKIRKIIFFF